MGFVSFVGSQRYIVKSSLADTSLSTTLPPTVAAFSYRSLAIFFLSASEAGALPVWSKYPVRRTWSVDSAKWLTQCACALSVCSSFPYTTNTNPTSVFFYTYCYYSNPRVMGSDG